MGSSDTTFLHLLGQTIDHGRIQLVQTLGAGSSGVVFLAVEQSHGVPTTQTYAVKCILKADPSSHHFDLQQREIEHHRKVNGHPNVLNLIEVIEEDPYIFVVLEFYSGGDLFKLITETGRFNGDQQMIKRIFLQLLDAVAYCHSQGIYHRDIKPENILCSRDGTEVVLADFGLSTKNVYTTNFGAGSFSYMSPECLKVDVLQECYSSAANDVWGLGVILCSMISGRNPWRYAVSSDACYRAYLYNPNFLQTMLPISRGANDILRRIFSPEYSRISLRQLRHEIVELETFFMSPEEIISSGEQVQAVAGSYFGKHYEQDSGDMSSTFGMAPASDGSTPSLKSDKVVIANKAHLNDIAVRRVHPPALPNRPAKSKDLHSKRASETSSQSLSWKSIGLQAEKRRFRVNDSTVPSPLHSSAASEPLSPSSPGLRGFSPAGMLRRMVERMK